MIMMTIQLLQVITEAQKYYIQGENKFKVFDYLLSKILDITESEYGFIGELLYDDNKMPFLRTYAITNIAWTDKLKKFYKENTNKGWDFRALDNLFGLVITENQIIISNDPTNDRRRGGKTKLPHGHPPLNTYAGIPFYHKDKIIGMVGIANKNDGYSDEYINTLNPFFDTCSTLISGFKIKQQYENIQTRNDMYISKMSHDLRTPLNAIFGYSQLIEINTKDKIVLDYNKIIQNSGTTLLNLIDDILLISREYINIEIVPINFNKFINEQIDMIKPLCKTNNITIQLSDIDNDIIILVDIKLIKNIFSNLLTNAIKYNKINGYVTITMTVKQELLHINIIDTGIGINEDGIHDIFEPFYRCDNVSHIEGNGLGLSIVKKNIKLINGDISVTSEINKGSNFLLKLQYKYNTSDTIYDILYIEDNPINQDLLQKIADIYGFTIDIADSVNNGIKYIKNKKYKVYLLDLGLPDGNINDILPNIDNYDQIIVLTADASISTKQEIHNLGIKTLITKPFNISNIVSLISKIISDYKT